MKKPSLVADILKQVVDSVDVPVTLKMRTGWDLENRNAVQIARMAEDIGIQSLAVHGRSRACRFNGMAEYDTIAEVVAAVNIPVFANGDIDSGQNAQKVLNHTAASGVMIGRAAQGRPWIFAEINQYLSPSLKKIAKSNTKTPWHFTTEQKNLLLEHLELIHRYYGRFETENFLSKSIKQSKINKDRGVDLAVKISRKHVCWYFNQMVQYASNLKQKHTSDFSVATSSCLVADSQAIKTIEIAKKQFNRLLVAKDQLQFLKQFFSETNLTEDIAA